MTISRIPDLDAPDPRTLDAGQREACEGSYRSVVGKDLLPAHQAHEDPVRRELDERLYGEVRGMGARELEGVGVVRAKEPTLHGGEGGVGAPGDARGQAAADAGDGAQRSEGRPRPRAM